MSSDLYGYPHVRIELCVFTLLEDKLGVLLVRHAQRPGQDKWALPNGDLRTHQDSDLAAGAERVAGAILPGTRSSLKQQCTVGGSKRDAKHAWTLSVVYRAVINHGWFTPNANIPPHNQRWLTVSDLNKSHDIAPGYQGIIEAAAADFRRQVKALDIPFQLLPASFTLADLQLLCQQLLCEELDRASFRRRVLNSKILQKTDTRMTGTAFRPAQLYRPAG